MNLGAFRNALYDKTCPNFRTMTDDCAKTRRVKVSCRLPALSERIKNKLATPPRMERERNEQTPSNLNIREHRILDSHGFTFRKSLYKNSDKLKKACKKFFKVQEKFFRLVKGIERKNAQT